MLPTELIPTVSPAWSPPPFHPFACKGGPQRPLKIGYREGKVNRREITGGRERTMKSPQYGAGKQRKEERSKYGENATVWSGGVSGQSVRKEFTFSVCIFRYTEYRM